MCDCGCGGDSIVVVNSVNSVNTTSPTQIDIANTVFVSKNGDDGTGLVERIDKPFLTIGAAMTAALTLTPAATKRILVYVFAGEYEEQIILKDYVDIYLSNATVHMSSGDGGVLDDNNVAVNCKVYGNGNIKRTKTDSSTSPYTIYVRNASTNLSIIVNQIDASASTLGAAIYSTAGNINVTCKDITVGSHHAIISSGGNITFEGNIITSSPSQRAISVTDASSTIIVKGDIQCDSAGAIIASAGTVYLYGNINSDATSSAAIYSTNGHIYIYGNVEADFIAISKATGSGNIRLYGNVVSLYASGAGVNITGGGLWLYGDLSTANEGISVQGGSAVIKGDITSNDQCIRVSSGSCYHTGTGISSTDEAVETSSTGSFFGLDSVYKTLTSTKDAVTAKNSAMILKNCTLVSGASGNSVGDDGSARNVKIYGTCSANTAIDSSITLLVGTVANNGFIVDANVTY